MKAKLTYFEWGKRVYELLDCPHGDDRDKKLKFLADIYNYRSFFGKSYTNDVSPEDAVSAYIKGQK